MAEGHSDFRIFFSCQRLCSLTPLPRITPLARAAKGGTRPSYDSRNDIKLFFGVLIALSEAPDDVVFVPSVLGWEEKQKRQKEETVKK
jgi:hypothetical protein